MGQPVNDSDIDPTSIEEPQQPHSDSDVDPGSIELPDEKYQTPGQQAKTVLEGGAQGLIGPLAPYAETHDIGAEQNRQTGLSDAPGQNIPDLPPIATPEDIAGRARANPMEHRLSEAATFIGSAILGTGEAGVLSKLGPTNPAAASALTKIGSGAARGAIQTGAYQGGNEVAKSILGQSDPQNAVAPALWNIGAASLLGLATGGGSTILGVGGKSAATKVARTLQDTKLGQTLKDVKIGMGIAASAKTPEEVAQYLEMAKQQGMATPGTRLGIGLYNKVLSQGPGEAVKAKLSMAGGAAGGIPGYEIGKTVGNIVKEPINKYSSKVVQKYVAPAVIKALSTGENQGLTQTMDYANAAGQGEEALNMKIKGLFDKTARAGQATGLLSNQEARDTLKEFIEGGGVDQQIREQNSSQPPVTPQFAKGGEILPPEVPDEEHIDGGLKSHLPEHNMLLQTARGRISGYLNSVRPTKNIAKLPFDKERTDPNKERIYNRVLDLANHPQNIVEHIHQGNLLPQHVQAFNAMYPELHQVMSQKIMNHLAQQSHDEERPPSHIRQGLSLFLGTPLDSGLTQPSIAAAQGTFIQQQQAKAPPEKSDSALNKLSKNSQTSEQARDARQNKD